MAEEVTILEIKNLSKYFGGVPALKSVNLSIRKNSIHGLIGPNGAGKSTLFNIVSGLCPPTEGRIFFNSEDITNSPAQNINRKGISRTFQAGKLVSNMTVLDNVMSGKYNANLNPLTFIALTPFQFAKEEKEIEKQARDLLDFIGISSYAQRWANELVWVERQLVQIGRALMSKPLLLMLDEPTAGMGAKESKKVARLIQRINKKGITIIVISHDVAFITEISDRITVLDFGQKISEGNPGQIQRDLRVREAYLGTEE